MAKPGRRANGEGSLYFRKEDNTWRGKVQVGFSEEGRPRYRYVCGRTKTEAKAKLDELNRQMSAGVEVDKHFTVRAFVERWLQAKAVGSSARTIELYTGYLQRVSNRIGRLDLTKVTPLHVQGIVDDATRESGVATANKVRKVMFGMFEQARRWRLVAWNPVDGVDPLKEEPQEFDIWTPAEAACFLDVARSHRLYALFYLAMSTGMRKGELIALRWSDLAVNRLRVSRSVTRVNNRLSISVPKTKSGNRVVSLSEDVIDVLEGHRQRQLYEAAGATEGFNTDSLVFCNQDGNMITPMALHHVFKRLQTRAGVKRVRFHDLRHLHVSLLIRSGVSAEVVADRVGHRDGSFTLRQYTHVFAESKRAAAIPLTNLLAHRGPIN